MSWPLTIGTVGLTGIVFLTLFFIRGGAFGTLNDICNALMALLTAAWAWRLNVAATPRPARTTAVAAGAGALVAGLGSVLVIFRLTGWYLAGLVSTLGYALIGIWLLGASQAALRSRAWPRPVAQSGRGLGALMALGVLAVPGIVARVDDPAAAPWWANAGLALAAGWALLFPLWCLWLGRSAHRPGPRLEAPGPP